MPVSCSDLSKSHMWALVLHKTAVLQIKATGASKGQLLIVLVRPVMSVFLNTHMLRETATEHGPHVISRVHLNVLLFGSVSSSVWLPVLILSVSQ